MPTVDRFRQLLFLLAVAFSAAAAWRGGSAFFQQSPADAALLAQDFPPAQPPQAARREDRTLESFKALTGRRLVVPPPTTQALPLGPPPFKLLGTRYDAVAPQDSTAMVLNSKGDVRSYKVGETVMVDEAKVLAVVGPRARFLWRGREIELGPEGPIQNPVVVTPPGEVPLPSQREFTISPAEWNGLYANAFQLMTQVHVQVNMVNGQPEGVQILSMDEKFPGRKYGLQPMDVVRSVNGASLNNLQALEGLMGTLKKPQSIAVELERGGKRFTLTIKAEEPPKSPAPKPIPQKP